MALQTEHLLHKNRFTNLILKLPSALTFTNETEKLTSRMMNELLPDSNYFIYVDLPWSDLLDSCDEALWQYLTSEIKKMSLQREVCRIVTVCAHLNLPKHLCLLQDIGITHVYWTEAFRGASMWEEKFKIALKSLPQKSNFSYSVENCSRSFLFAFNKGTFIFSPTQQTTYKYQNLHISDDNAHLLPSAYFCFIDLDAESSSQLLWDCIECEVIPVFLKEPLFLDSELWKSASLVLNSEMANDDSLFVRCREIVGDDAIFDRYLRGLKQLKFLYSDNLFVYDIITDLMTETSGRVSNVSFLMDLIVSSKAGDISSIFFTSLISKLILYPEEVRDFLEDEKIRLKIRRILSQMKLENYELASELKKDISYSWLSDLRLFNED